MLRHNIFRFRQAMKTFIMLGACGSNALLPQQHELPADLFTSCLTTPIRVALKWYAWKQKAMSSNATGPKPNPTPDRIGR